MLHRYNVNQLENTSRPHAFCLSKKGSASLTLAGDSNESMTRWLAVLSHSIERNNQVCKLYISLRFLIFCCFVEYYFVFVVLLDI